MKPEQTLQQSSRESKSSSGSGTSERKWAEKWLRLRQHHPKVVELERAVERFCGEMWRSPREGRLLMLSGKNGSGKTHCGRAVHRWVNFVGREKQWMNGPSRVEQLHSLFWSWPELLDSLKAGNWDLVDGCIAAPCLIIDELGGGHDPSQVGVDKLCQILSRRERKWTLITTNVFPGAWEQAFDVRVASRFLRNSEIVDLSGVPDYGAAGQFDFPTI